MAVPLRNVYYLLCYAWDQWGLEGVAGVDGFDGDRVENLLGYVLRDGVSGLLRRGLDRGYVLEQEECRRPRGKVLVSQTIQRMLAPHGRVACEADDLCRDVVHNRLIKATLTSLVELPRLDGKLRAGLTDLRQRMGDVADVGLTVAGFRKVQLHQNLANYAFILNVCELVARSLLPEPASGRRRFRPFTASDQEMGRLFEAFVRNFLKGEQELFSVTKGKVPWDAVPLAGADLAWLPEMETDVILQRPAQRIVIETKYYNEMLQSRYGSRKLISGHLYQLQAYLGHLAATPGPQPVGVLLYAKSGEAPRLDYRLGGHTVLVRSLDLDREWREIRRQLLGLADEFAGLIGEGNSVDATPILR